MKIKFLPLNVEIEAPAGATLLSVAQANKIPIRSLCKGGMTCSECRVKILSGEGNLVAPSKAEIAVIGSTYYVDQRRLACQARPFGDVIVDITNHVESGDSKKPRGHRLSRTISDSKAVLDTLILSEDKTKDDKNKDNVKDNFNQGKKK